MAPGRSERLRLLGLRCSGDVTSRACYTGNCIRRTSAVKGCAMSRRSNIVRWVIPFPLGLLLTPLAALSGTLGAMALGGMTYCFLSLTMSCSDFLLAGLLFGTMFAAPCTALLIPLFYALWGSNIPAVFFAVICSVLGVVTMQSWEFISHLMNPAQLRLPGPDPFLTAALIGAFVFGLIYFPIMRFIESRLSPRHIAEGQGAAT
jgi:hypothetical protein